MNYAESTQMQQIQHQFKIWPQKQQWKGLWDPLAHLSSESNLHVAFAFNLMMGVFCRLFYLLFLIVGFY